MRIYQNPAEAMRETERELFEMGVSVQVQTCQDKNVRNNLDYLTKEIRGYAFKIVNWVWDINMIKQIMIYFFREKADDVLTYILAEFEERVSYRVLNPGTAYLHRKELWQEFLHKGKFAYTYSERMTPQLGIILQELKKNPETRQAIITIHSNICPADVVVTANDLDNIGAGARVPCSMYYQFMIREGRLDLIYAMRSCDFLIHFPIDISIALLLQDWFASQLKLETGTFTWFCGSLHAYQKDLKERGIF